MGTYAKETTVSSENSRAEIERTLQRYKASHFAYAQSPEQSVVMFVAHDRQVKFVISMPRRDAPAFTEYKRGEYGAVQRRTPDAATKLYEQAIRQRWRALALVIKAKLEAVEAGINEFEVEFMGNIVLPNGQTMGEWGQPEIARAYESNTMPEFRLELGRGAA